MCNSTGFYLYFSNCAPLSIFIFVLLYPHPLLSHSFNFLRVLFLVLSSTIYMLLCLMHIYTFMQMIRIIHGNFPIILRSINLMKSEANILGLLLKPIISDFFPQICAPAFPIYLQPCPRHILLCWPTSLFSFYSKHPSSALALNLPQHGYHLLPFISSVSHWILVLCLAVIFIALFHCLILTSLKILILLFQSPYFCPAH